MCANPHRTRPPGARPRGAGVPSVIGMTDAPVPPSPGPAPWTPPPGVPGIPQHPGAGRGPGAGPAPATAYAPPPPAPPSREATAWTEFWAARSRPAPRGVLLGAAAVGLGVAVLVVGNRPGLGAALMGAAVWAPAVPALVRRRAVGPLLLVAAAVALAGVVAVRDATWLVALCVVGSVGAGVAAVADARTALGLLVTPFTAGLAVLRALPWVRRGVAVGLGGRSRQVLAAGRSVAVTAVLLLVFGALLASADEVFATYVTGVEVDLLPARVAAGLVGAVVAAAAAHLALAPPAWGAFEARRPRAARLGEWLLPVGSLAALVLAFVLLQVSALLGGHRHVLESAGLTYAEYAREGFGQLVAVTVLTLVVVALAARRAPRGTRRDRAATAAALGALCVGALGVVWSALHRMSLYVDAFGLTRLRVFVVAVEVALGVVLLLVMAAGVRWRAPWLPRAVVGVAAAALLALAAVNPDALVLRHNVSAAERGTLVADLDLGYLRGLSSDATPDAARLAEPVRSCVLDRDEVSEPGLAGWNLARSRADAALRRVADDLQPCHDMPLLDPPLRYVP